MKSQSKSGNAYTKEAMATVTACHYEFGAGQALAFGIPKSKRFQISFNYWADEELHTGEFASAKAIPQGTLFPIRYNPESPHEHSKSDESGRPQPLAMLAVIVAVFLFAITGWLMHGCGRFN